MIANHLRSNPDDASLFPSFNIHDYPDTLTEIHACAKGNRATKWDRFNIASTRCQDALVLSDNLTDTDMSILADNIAAHITVGSAQLAANFISATLLFPKYRNAALEIGKKFLSAPHIWEGEKDTVAEALEARFGLAREIFIGAYTRVQNGDQIIDQLVK